MVNLTLNKNQKLVITSILVLYLAVLLYNLDVWFVVKVEIYFVSFFVAFVVLAFFYHQYKTPSELNKIEEWARETRVIIDRSKVEAKPFKIEFDQNEWDILVKKLELARYFEPLNEKYAARNEYGFDPEYAKELCDYWRKGYSWEKRLNILNRYPQFTIKCDDDVTLHYVHYVTNKNNSSAKRLNLMIMDGWPGSYFGSYKIIDYLESNFKDHSFDIVIPTIPGFGFSTPLSKPVDAPDTAKYFDALMRYVHNNENVEYYIHGQDWGSIVTNSMGTLYPSRVKGIHMTMPPLPRKRLFLTLLAGSISKKLILSEDEITNNVRSEFTLIGYVKNVIARTGYFHMQATTPDTLGHGLTDSPVGLLTYILEKYSFGTFNKQEQIIGHKDAGLDALDRDDLLDIVTFYWMSNSICSSCRFYKANMSAKSAIKAKISKHPTAQRCPVGVVYFKNELFGMPESLVRLSYPKLTRFRLMSFGGHFANFENPNVCAQEFVEFIKSV